MKRRLALLACGLFLAGWPPVPGRAAPREDERRWQKLVSPNFELYSNAGAAEARELLRDLETFRLVVSRFLGLTNVQHEPAMVYLFDSERSFEPYKPRYQGRPKPVNGIHVADPLGTALAVGRQNRTEGTMRVLYHEYTHLLTARQFRHVPPWASEGVAEVFSTFEGQGNSYEIGIAVTNHVRYLQRSPPLPVRKLLQVDHDSPDYNELERAGKFYASSWLLSHYLLFARRGFETNLMARYAAACATTTNRAEAFRRGFGSGPDEFDAAVIEFLKGGNYTVVRQTYGELASARPREAKLAPGELDFALGRLLQMTQQTEAAQARLEEAMKRAPQDPRPRAALALMAWRQNDRERSAALVDEAIQLGTRESFIFFLAAEGHYRRFLETKPVGDERAREIDFGKALCERAVALDPWSAAAHHILGIYVLAEHPRSPALASAHIQQALRCDPEYQPALLTWASLQAAQGNYVGARQILQRMLAGPLSAGIREEARETLDQVERVAARAGAGAPRKR